MWLSQHFYCMLAVTRQFLFLVHCSHSHLTLSENSGEDYCQFVSAGVVGFEKQQLRIQHQSLVVALCYFIMELYVAICLTWGTCCTAIIWSYWLAYDLGSFPIEAARPWTECCCSYQFHVQCASHLCFLSTGGMILPCAALLLFRQRLLQCTHLICQMLLCMKSAGCSSAHDSCVYAWWYRI